MAVGTAKGMTFSPRRSEGGAIRIYRISPDGRSLDLLHKTDVEGIPGALVAFHGRLLAGEAGHPLCSEAGGTRPRLPLPSPLLSSQTP